MSIQIETDGDASLEGLTFRGGKRGSTVKIFCGGKFIQRDTIMEISLPAGTKMVWSAGEGEDIVIGPGRE